MKKVVLMLALFFLLRGVSFGDEMVCGNKFVNRGDLKLEVLELCGEPISKEVVGYRTSRRGTVEKVTEQWIYGPVKGFLYILEFEGGFLKRVQKKIKR